MTMEFSGELKFDERDGTTHTVRTAAELRDLIQREAEFWRFLSPIITAAKNYGNTAAWPQQQIKMLRKSLDAFENGSANFDDLRQALGRTFGTDRDRLPLSTSAEAKGLQTLATTLPAESAAYAVTHYFNRAPHDGSPPMGNEPLWLGITALHLMKLGISPQTVADSRAAFDELRNRYREDLKLELLQLERERDLGHQELQAMLAAMQAQNNDLAAAQTLSLESAEQRHTAQLEAASTALQEAKDRWKHTHDAFTAQLHLKAPKEYWEDKRKGHQRRARIWGGVALSYAVGALVGMVLMIDGEFNQLLTLPASTSLGAYVALAARGLVISIIVFWVGRLLVRMFLSELHLGMDAYERSTMVSTYLALTNEGNVTPEERGLVLAPLFRPTADGLVKDDASIDPTVFALFGKSPAKAN